MVQLLLQTGNCELENPTGRELFRFLNNGKSTDLTSTGFKYSHENIPYFRALSHP